VGAKVDHYRKGPLDRFGRMNHTRWNVQNIAGSSTTASSSSRLICSIDYPQAEWREST